jgi:pyridoxine kinase
MIVLSINSHVVAGRVGNAAALPAFAALGIEAWALPTVIYSHTPGPTGFSGSAVPLGLIDSVLGRFESDGTIATLAAVHVGYAREAAMVSRIARFLVVARRANPELLISVDPVLGDEGRLYIPEPAALAIKYELVPLADLLTPNLFELGWLVGRPITDLRQAVEAAGELKRKRVLLTSAPSRHPNRMATLLVEGDGALCVETPRLPFAPHGTGDVLAALFLARVLRRETGEAALALTVASVYDLIAAAAGAGDLPLTEHSALLAAPASRFSANQLGGESRGRA